MYVPVLVRSWMQVAADSARRLRGGWLMLVTYESLNFFSERNNSSSDSDNRGWATLLKGGQHQIYRLL